MSQEYFTILTTLGEAKVAESIAEGTPIDITEMAVGDAEYTPSKGQTSLINEQWRDSLNSLERGTENPNQVIAEAVIPTTDGGWYVHEVGIFDSDGDLFAISKYPETYKPTLPEGSAKDLLIRIIMEVSSEVEVTLLIDPAVVLASRAYVDDRVPVIATADVDTGTSTVDSFDDTLGDVVFWDYKVKKGANVRAGTVMAAWDADGDIVQASERSTDDVVDTSDVTFDVDISDDVVRLRATATSDGWTIKVSRRVL